MANKFKTMLQIRRILQLMSNGISKRKIAVQMEISRTTIDHYESRFNASGKLIHELLSLPDEELSLIVHNNAPPNQKDSRYEYLQSQFSVYRNELHTKIGVTRFLLWEEYRINHPDGYSYSQFCEHFAHYLLRFKAVMHLDHQPGISLQVDFAGDKLSYVDRQTGEIIECPVLVCSLPFSSFNYVEVLSCCKQEEVIGALNRCIHYLGGVTQNIKSDNMKQWVTKPNRYEPTFNELTEQWSLHYNTSIAAARPYKPRDKATVEKSVDLAYKRIYAPLRNQVFYSLQQLNEAVWVQLDLHNKTPMQKKSYSRYERFIQEELPCLKPLPSEDFVIKHTAKAKVQKNYHIILGEDWHQYSVPYQYIGKTITLVYDLNQVEIYLDMKRIAVHLRNKRRHGYSTLPDHMPSHHQYYHKAKGWKPDYFISEAKKIGPNTVKVIEQILGSRQFTEQSYNSCLGITRLAKMYEGRMEAACTRVLLSGRVSYKRLNDILSNNKDKEEIQLPIQYTIPLHDNIRGSQAYN